MAVTLVVNGTGYTFPNTGDESWGDNVTNWATAVTASMLQKTGGTFTLSADVDFGTSFGLKSLYYKSRSALPATTGQVRLGTAEVIAWRNNANSANLPLTTDASDNLTWNGVTLASSAGVVPVASGGTGLASYTTGDTLYASAATTLSKLAIGAVNTVDVSTGTAPSWALLANANISGSAAIAYSKLALTGAVLNADLAGSIAYSKLTLTNSILNADVNSAAAINLSKTDKLFDTEATLTQVSTPANPAAGKNKFYPKSDGFFYSLDSSGAERKIGSGAGGVNYFSANSDIESGTTGYSVAADGSTATVTLASPSVFTSAISHGMVTNQPLYLTTTGALPTGFATGTLYYVIYVSATTFQLSATQGGTGLAGSVSQSGIHTYRPSIPVTGAIVSVAATATISASADTGLRGAKNLLFTPGNVGDYLLYTITPDSADTAKMLQLSFDYKFTTPASYVDGDLQVYLYDVGNSLIIQPAAYKILSTSKPNTFKCVFQTPGTGMSTIRVLVIQNTANTSYASARFDNFNCGPQTTSLGPPISDWTVYTPTFTGFGSVVSITSEWRRIGDTMQIRGVATTGTVTGVAAKISIPAGFTANYAADTILEGAIVSDYTGAAQAGMFPLLLIADTANIQVSKNNSASGLAATLANNFNAASGSKVSWWASFKVTGWSSNVLMSSDTDTRVVAAKLTSSSNNAFGNGHTKITYATTVYDTHGAYSGGTYTCPVPGTYEVAGHFAVTSFTSGGVDRRMDLEVYKNGALQNAFASVMAGQTGASQRRMAGGAVGVQCNAGDTIDIYGYSDDAGLILNSTAADNFVIISRISGPATIAATETVAARYTNVAGSTLTKSANNTVPFANKDYDTHGAFVTDTFTCPISGKYAFKFEVIIATGATWASGDIVTMEALKNGTASTGGNVVLFFGTFVGGITAQLHGTINCLAGDTIKLNCNPQKAAAGNVTLNTTAGYNCFAVERIGN